MYDVYDVYCRFTYVSRQDTGNESRNHEVGLLDNSHDEESGLTMERPCNDGKR